MILRARQFEFHFPRPALVMGIVNVTPDSFSGDGLIEERLSQDEVIQRAVAQAQECVSEGATFIDVGGESTRPNSAPISLEQELARVIPVILRQVEWKQAPFGKLKPLPTGGKPVIQWTDRDSAFFDIAQGIRKVIEELAEKRRFH